MYKFIQRLTYRRKKRKSNFDKKSKSLEIHSYQKALYDDKIAFSHRVKKAFEKSLPHILLLTLES